MELEKLDLEISQKKLELNLKLYRSIKDLVQIKPSDLQVVLLLERINLLLNQKSSFKVKRDNLLKFTEELKGSKVKDRLLSYFDLFLEDLKALKVLNVSLNLIRYKDFVLERSKVYVTNFRVSPKLHIMDFLYDQNMLNVPYSMRVTGALLIKILFSDEQSFLRNEIVKIEDLDPETILQVIFAESSSQSIRSLAGASYEERFENLLSSQNIRYDKHSFDPNLSSVEYDFLVHLKNSKKIGFSVKRTLRERYKQNHESIELLDIDAMVLVTLGIDLNKDKVDYILEKEKHYIFVASDIYNKTSYLNENPKVYSLKDLNEVLLDTLITT